MHDKTMLELLVVASRKRVVVDVQDDTCVVFSVVEKKSLK